jgi:hypothetical protein
MSLYTRFGDRLELVRLATIADVQTFERRKADKVDRDRTRDGWRAIAKYSGGPNRGAMPGTNGCGDENVGKETLVDASFLRADDGWSEISKAFQALNPGAKVAQ